MFSKPFAPPFAPAGIILCIIGAISRAQHAPKHKQHDSTHKTLSELSIDELYGILEQQCPYQDLDGLDQAGLHIMFWQDQALIAYARLLPVGQRYPDAASIGRVVTSKLVRGGGLGQQLMETALAECQSAWPEAPITISAQAYLEAFYQRLGFEPQGEAYLEDGIPHIQMHWQARKS